MGATGCDFLCLVFLTVQLPLRDPFLKTALCGSQHSADVKKPRAAAYPRAQKPYMCVCVTLRFQGHCRGLTKAWLRFLVRISTGGFTEGLKKQQTRLFLAQIINHAIWKLKGFYFRSLKPRRGEARVLTVRLKSPYQHILRTNKERSGMQSRVNLRTHWALGAQHKAPKPQAAVVVLLERWELFEFAANPPADATFSSRFYCPSAVFLFYIRV